MLSKIKQAAYIMQQTPKEFIRQAAIDQAEYVLEREKWAQEQTRDNVG